MSDCPGSFERLDQELSRIGGKRRSQPAQRQREILPNSGIVVLRFREGLGQLGSQRAPLLLGERRVGHQPRQLVGSRPPPVASARSDVGEVFRGRSVFAEQSAKADVHQHRGADDEQRDEEELNGDRGRCSQRVRAAASRSTNLSI